MVNIRPEKEANFLAQCVRILVNDPRREVYNLMLQDNMDHEVKRKPVVMIWTKDDQFPVVNQLVSSSIMDRLTGRQVAWSKTLSAHQKWKTLFKWRLWANCIRTLWRNAEKATNSFIRTTYEVMKQAAVKVFFTEGAVWLSDYRIKKCFRI